MRVNVILYVLFKFNKSFILKFFFFIICILYFFDIYNFFSMEIILFKDCFEFFLCRSRDFFFRFVDEVKLFFVYGGLSDGGKESSVFGFYI